MEEKQIRDRNQIPKTEPSGSEVGRNDEDEQIRNDSGRGSRLREW